MGDMRLVTVHTGLAFENRLMRDFEPRDFFEEILMALLAKRNTGLGEQILVRSAMGNMTRRAFVHDRWMHGNGFVQAFSQVRMAGSA